MTREASACSPKHCGSIPAVRWPRWPSSAMEGLPGDQAELDQAIQKFDQKALSEIERQYKRPVFARAQLGFNNNVQYNGATYHVQTEDSGIDRPHVITHLFADGGRVVKSVKRSYANELGRQDVGGYVRSLMKAQHMEMVIALRHSDFDEVIAGRAVGGMSVREGVPDIKVRRGAGEAVSPERHAARPVLLGPRRPRSGFVSPWCVASGVVPSDTSRAATTWSSGRRATSR